MSQLCFCSNVLCKYDMIPIMWSASQQVHYFIGYWKSSILSNHVVGVIVFWVCEELPQDISLWVCCMAEGILFCHIGPRQASSCCQLGAGHGVVAAAWCRPNRVQNSTKVAISIWWDWVELVAGLSTFDSVLFFFLFSVCLFYGQKITISLYTKQGIFF